MTDQTTRRGLFAFAAGAGLLMLGRKAPAQEAAAQCFNPDSLPASQKSLRQSLGFQLQSADPKKHCASCAFFTATSGGCGTCMLLSGGAVTTQSVCNSWALKS